MGAIWNTDLDPHSFYDEHQAHGDLPWVFFVCPAKLANPAACDSKWPHPVHGEENPTRKGVAGQLRGLKEAIGGRWNVAKVNLNRPVVRASVQKDMMPDT